MLTAVIKQIFFVLFIIICGPHSFPVARYKATQMRRVTDEEAERWAKSDVYKIWFVGPHRRTSARCGLLLQMSMLVTTARPAKTAEQIPVPFGI